MAGGLSLPSTVRTDDGSLIVMPGRAALASKGGKVLKVNAGGTAYELGDAGGGGGGIVGQVDAFAAGGTVKWNAGANQLDYYSADFTGRPYNPNGGALPFGVVGDFGQLNIPTAGWYNAVLYLRVLWNNQADAPANYCPYIGGSNDEPHNDYGILPRVQYGTQFGIVAMYNPGPMYVAANGAIWAECRGTGGPAAVANDTANSALCLTVTKLS